MSTVKYYDEVSGTWKYLLQGPKGDKGDQGDPGTGAVDSVNGQTGAVVLDQDDIADGTTYKQYSATEKTKLSGIASGAEVNVNADWNSVSGDSQILNKPTLGTAAATDSTDYATAAQGAKADTALQSIVAGDNVTVDDTDPLNPVVSSTGGDVVGPGSSTDNAVTRFDGTTGNLIQNSSVSITDSGKINFPNGYIDNFSTNYTEMNGTGQLALTAGTYVQIQSQSGTTLIDGDSVNLRPGISNDNATVNGTPIVTTTGSQTLTNKRINPRLLQGTSGTSVTPNIGSYDMYTYSALAAGLTINAPTGTPVSGNKLLFRIRDNGTARALTWDSIYRGVGVSLPTTTTANKTMYIGMIHNGAEGGADGLWDVIAVTIEA